MGQAFDGGGNVLGEAHGETKREVFDQLMKDHPDADEIRIKAAETAAAQAHAAMTAAQRPSIGRIVLYRPAEHDPGHNDTLQVPAVITRVFSETCVNLQVLNDGPTNFWKTSVLRGDGPMTWNWPPRI
jgi:hypothetical protein